MQVLYMSFPKFLGIFAALLFSIIGIAAWMKSGSRPASPVANVIATPVEIELDREVRVLPATSTLIASNSKTPIVDSKPPSSSQTLPDVDRIDLLFNKNGSKLPLVETITYKSKVAWQKGRPAWLSDYASHYSTSRHFIARSLNGKPDYFKQDVAEGDRFNVLNPNKNIQFHLLIDASRSKMWFYAIDTDAGERTLLKTYPLSLGRIDKTKPSGMLTPLGKYSLGSKIAIYKPKTMGIYNGQKTEMIRVFGTRWIPFDKELEGVTAPAAGLGIHGVPWIPNERGEYIEDIASLGKYESDGCVRLATADIEELFAIIITRLTTIEFVKDFYEAKLPGIEIAAE
jgi:hypothetical protein